MHLTPKNTLATAALDEKRRYFFTGAAGAGVGAKTPVLAIAVAAGAAAATGAAAGAGGGGTPGPSDGLNGLPSALALAA